MDPQAGGVEQVQAGRGQRQRDRRADFVAPFRRQAGARRRGPSSPAVMMSTNWSDPTGSTAHTWPCSSRPSPASGAGAMASGRMPIAASLPAGSPRAAAASAAGSG